MRLPDEFARPDMTGSKSETKLGGKEGVYFGAAHFKTCLCCSYRAVCIRCFRLRSANDRAIIDIVGIQPYRRHDAGYGRTIDDVSATPIRFAEQGRSHLLRLCGPVGMHEVD